MSGGAAPEREYRLHFTSAAGEAWSGYTHTDYAAAVTDAAETQAALGAGITVTVVSGLSREPAAAPESEAAHE